MRLLHAGTRTLHEFEGSIPEYAILSHTWGADEIKFDDILREPSRSQWSNKIDGCCGVALRHKVEYVWIDTCCINKSSSTELSEAINSMYNWYRGAKVCLVYLADVPSDEDPGDENSRFRSSRWFTRGWTLQEMLAPPLLIFYTGDWVLIGEVLRGPDCALDGFDIEEGEFGQERRDGLSWLISGITQIPKIYVLGEPLANASVAQRMSWAARRETTRLEDQAYCLLGIFSINMPLLYGEGRRAFQRLQEEIMKEQHDHTLFTWAWPTDAFGGCLAQSPSNF
ncbi:HET-domain-containing protein, partial [Thozetella sp. PMI_491]